MDKTERNDWGKDDPDNDPALLDDDDDNNTNLNKNKLNSHDDFSVEELALELKEARDDLEHYRKLYDDTFNKLKYSLADFDNYRKNVEKQNNLRLIAAKVRCCPQLSIYVRTLYVH